MYIHACVSVAVWGLLDSKMWGKSCHGCSEGRLVTLSFWCGESNLCGTATGRSAARPRRSQDHRCAFVSVKSEDVKWDRVLHLNPLLLTLEDMCQPMLQSLQHAVIPRLERTLQEVATPTCDAFASTWQYFLETYEDIIDLASKSTSVKDIKNEVHWAVWPPFLYVF